MILPPVIEGSLEGLSAKRTYYQSVEGEEKKHRVVPLDDYDLTTLY